MPHIDLQTPVRFGGRWYRPGKSVDVPQELYDQLSPDGAPEGGKAADTDAVPDGFPGRDALAAGGFTTLSAIRAAKDSDLDKVTGIGPATLKEIRAALK